MTTDELKEAKRLIGALSRMPPKPHSEMKLRKSKPGKKDQRLRNLYVGVSP